VIDPECAFCRVTAGKNRSPVLHRYAIYARATAGCQYQFIAECCCEFTMWGGAGLIFCPSRRAHQSVTVVRNGTYLLHHAIRTRLPPFVQRDAMPIRVSAGANCGVAGGCDQIRVVVIAICKMRALLKEEVPSVLCFELRAVAVEIITAKLIEDKYYNELRLSIICIGSYQGSG
jgi:hypothetical protein